jgi:pimeloyl-ACP methyl ester carboxylesterase
MDLETAPRKRFTASDGARLAYVDVGEGDPIVLVHGWTTSLNWWREQVPWLAERYRVVALDLRGFGDSDKVPRGHTMQRYARDVHELLGALGVDGALAVGWSMGAFVLWSSVQQFGRGRARAMVFVGQSAGDLKTDANPDGIVTYAELVEWVAALQTDQEGFLRGLLPLMVKQDPTPEQLDWMVRDALRLPAHIAAVSLVTQTTFDAYPAFPAIDFPTQVYFGTDPKMYEIAQGRSLAAMIPGCELVVFEDSGHIPHLEEPARFNRELDTFARRVFGRD